MLPRRRAGSPDRPAVSGVWAPERRALTVGLLLAVTLVAFESLSVATIMPIVGRELDDLALYGWVFSAFFLGDLVGIVAAGAQADRGSLVPPFVIGLGLFAVGLVIDGSAPTMAVLVVGRAIQGLGAGAVPTVAYVAIGRRYPDAIRPVMFASLSTAWVVPGLVGPAVAGLVADHLTWRFVFLGLIPLVLIGLAITAPALRGDVSGPVSPDRPRAVRERVVPAIRVAVGAALVLGGLTTHDLLSLGLAAVGVVVGLPALLRLVPRGTLRAARGLPTVILIRGVATFAMFGAEAFLPLTLVTLRGASATEAGLALTAATLTWTAGSWLQARQMATWGAQRLIRLGLFGLTVGVAGVATVLVPGVPVEMAVVSWGLAGLGMGLGGAIVAAGAALLIAPQAYLGLAFGISMVVAALGVALTPRMRPAPATLSGRAALDRKST